MATLTRGQTFGATETITNTKLHALIDSGSVSAIVNADCDANMALADTKLADITTGNKVRGTAIGDLGCLPSSAGEIPIANLPTPFGSTYISLVSIPNASLLPLTLASWVDGVSLRNLASTPVDQQLRYNLIVQSLASGALCRYNGANNFVGVNPSVIVPLAQYIASTGGSLVTIASNANTLSDSTFKTTPMPRGGNIYAFFEARALNGAATGFAYFRINSVAVSATVATDSTFDDIAAIVPVSQGDVLEAYAVGTNNFEVQNFRILVLNPEPMRIM